MKRFLRWFAIVFVLLVLVKTMAVAFRPDLRGIRPESAAFFDRHGQLLRLTVAKDGNYRLWTPIDDVAASVSSAVLLHEDRTFFQHPGINPWALVKAIHQTYIRNGKRRGASTITMQLARMRFGISSESVSGKLQQMARALQLELGYSKKELLEAYLNWAPYGGNIEGIGTASLIYFHKPPQRSQRRRSDGTGSHSTEPRSAPGDCGSNGKCRT